MAIVKSFAVYSKKGQPGDMFYIKHNTDNFTVIDCCLNEDREKEILEEIKSIKAKKSIFRFISTHPDDDHICGITNLSTEIGIENFYCVKNNSNNPEGEEDFKTYCQLREGDNSFPIYKDFRIKWLNISDDKNGCSGINFLYPTQSNKEFNKLLDSLDNSWGDQNNISPIIEYCIANSASFLWFGDLESDFMNKIKNNVSFSETTVVFAPHHSRNSGTLPTDWLNKINPKIIVVGMAESENLNYYPGYNTITQNSAGDIVFEEDEKEENILNIYTSNKEYSLTFHYFNKEDKVGNISNGCYYKGSINIK